MKKTTIALLGTLILGGCDGTDTTNTGGAAGSGGETTSSSGGAGGTTDTGGTTTSTSSTTSSTTTSDVVVVGPPEGCKGSTSIAPATGQLGYQEANALACRRFVPPAGYPSLVSWTPAVGLTVSCVEMPFAVSFVAPIDPTWPIDVSPPEFLFTETPIDIDNTEPVIPVGLDLAEGMAFYACLRLPVNSVDGGVGCASACSMPAPGFEGAADQLFSDTLPDLTIAPLPTVDLEPLAVSPTEQVAQSFGNDQRAWRFTATFAK